MFCFPLSSFSKQLQSLKKNVVNLEYEHIYYDMLSITLTSLHFLFIFSEGGEGNQ